MSVPTVPAAPRKYGNTHVEYGGRVFDSKAEAAYARQLDLMRAAGLIRSWEPQPWLTLIGGKRETLIRYRPDFYVVPAEGPPYYVDVKGVLTAEFRLKLRLLRAVLPSVRLVLVRKDGTHEQVAGPRDLALRGTLVAKRQRSVARGTGGD